MANKSYDLIIFDGNNTAHKAYHVNKYLAIKKNGEVIHTGMCYGFLTMMLGIYEQFGYDGTKIMVAWDVRNSADSNKAILDSYKGNRAPSTQEEINEKIEFGKMTKRVQDLLATLNILQFKKDGTEADDIIATIVDKVSKEHGGQVLVITEDKDYRQLISKDVQLYGISQRLLWDKRVFQQKTGLSFPSRFVDYLALVGDGSDGYGGVKGFGEVKALEFINNQYWNDVQDISDTVFASPDILDEIDMSDRNRQILQSGIEDWKTCHKLALLDRNIKSANLVTKRGYSSLEPFKALLSYYSMNSLLSDDKLDQFESIRLSTNYYKLYKGDADNES